MVITPGTRERVPRASAGAVMAAVEDTTEGVVTMGEEVAAMGVVEVAAAVEVVDAKLGVRVVDGMPFVDTFMICDTCASLANNDYE